MLTPMALYVYGALRLDWGFNDLARTTVRNLVLGA
jgi:hypothetical protein